MRANKPITVTHRRAWTPEELADVAVAHGAVLSSASDAREMVSRIVGDAVESLIREAQRKAERVRSGGQNGHQLPVSNLVARMAQSLHPTVWALFGIDPWTYMRQGDSIQTQPGIVTHPSAGGSRVVTLTVMADQRVIWLITHCGELSRRVGIDLTQREPDHVATAAKVRAELDDIVAKVDAMERGEE